MPQSKDLSKYRPDGSPERLFDHFFVGFRIRRTSYGYGLRHWMPKDWTRPDFQTLVLGNYIAIYEHIRKLTYENSSPLYIHDVEKLNQQDNAVTHLFSADLLKHLCDNHPDHIGEIVYLFVFGKLIDAYQNCSLTHNDCVQLVLHA